MPPKGGVKDGPGPTAQVLTRILLSTSMEVHGSDSRWLATSSENKLDH